MDANLREQVLGHVRAQIISGRNGPGAMYSVPALAAELGVSTTPVREALLELARAGLIEPLRNRGFKVVAPTLQNLRDLFDLRELLEVRAAELFASKPRKKKRLLDELTRLANEVGAAVEADDVDAYIEADRRFHGAFIAAAENALLTQTAMSLRDKMRLYGISTRAGLERQAASVAEHHSLIALADAGAIDEIGALMKRHIRTWEPIFVDAIARSAKEPAPLRA